VALDDVTIGLQHPGRPLSMALVRFLQFDDALGDAFADFRAAVDAGVDDEGAEFESRVGSLADREDDFDAWLRREQTPLTPVYLEWLHVDPTTIFGFADGVVSVARFKDAPTTYRHPPGDTVSWEQSFDGDEVVLRIDGVELRRPIVFPPAAGPAVPDSDVTFLDVAWTP